MQHQIHDENLFVPFDYGDGEVRVHQDRDAIRDALAMQRGALITREEIDGLAKVDADFVVVSERIREAALAFMRDETNIAALLEGKNRAQAIGEYITRKIIARDAKLEAQNNIAEIRIRYERELGKLIQKLQADGELASKENNLRNHRSDTQSVRTLSDVGITHKQSSRWQFMAALPDENFEAHIAEAKENGWELTTAAIVAHGQQHSGTAPKKLYDDVIPLGSIPARVGTALQYTNSQMVRVVIYEVTAPADGASIGSERSRAANGGATQATVPVAPDRSDER